MGAFTDAVIAPQKPASAGFLLPKINVDTLSKAGIMVTSNTGELGNDWC